MRRKGASVALGFEDGAGDPKTAVISRRSAGSVDADDDGHHGALITDLSSRRSVRARCTRRRASSTSSTRSSPASRISRSAPGSPLGGTLVSGRHDGHGGIRGGQAQRRRRQDDGDRRRPHAVARAARKRPSERCARSSSRHLPKTTAEITFDDGYPPMAPTDGNRRLLAMYDRASRDLGFGPVDGGRSVARRRGGRVVRRAARADDHRRHRPLRPRRSFREGDGGPAQAAAQTKRAALLLYRLTQTSHSVP